MKRRQFLALLASAATATPVAASAQQLATTRRIAVLMSFAETDPEARSLVAAFLKGLQSRGWTPGQNLRVDYHWAAGDAGRLRTFASKLVNEPYDVNFVSGTPVVAALKQAGLTRPVVFVNVSDPVGTGLISNLAHPGGNLTGFTNFEFTMAGKWLELLKEAAPKTARVLFVHNPGNSIWRGMFRELEAAAPSIGMKAIAGPVRNAEDVERTINTLVAEPNGGLVVMPDATVAVHRAAIIAQAERHRLPAVYPYRYYIESGGLMAYGNDSADSARNAAFYVDRILRGEGPGELPVQAPTKFELLINLKTARKLGFEISPMMLARADEVIE